ncbi:S8 family serine peptidase [Shewanella sp. WXL01]|uniref:S8 family serine peptidase n=1 Tax=Shewanella sp. WXL01 TaxID=2709721 RepID=UPI00143867F0|nr:S8 family serine peptidase [Shewanella sp. WXL01]NKF52636.1 S8 family serine peptidase [Shewanella sp. WXL01]
MKIKKISLMTIAAMYAAGAGAAASQQPVSLSLASMDVQGVDISNEEYQRMHEFKNARLNRPTQTVAPNQHIRKVGLDKVPFQMETDLAPGEHTYIVQLSDAPIATYQGGISGLQATAASVAQGPLQFGKQPRVKLNLQSAASVSYLGYLENQQAKVLSDISAKAGANNNVRQSYKYAFNGMSLMMTQAQAARVAKLDGVRAVTRSIVQELHTDVGPEHIGADKVWSGAATGTEFTGAGITVGILDTGINSQHPSFAPMGDDGVAIINPLGTGNYLGDCEQVDFSHMCNDKLIGIRSYTEITDSYGDPVFRGLGWNAPWEHVRPANGEDYNGHGSHTASTVAGNVLLDVAYQVAESGYGEQITGRDTDLVFPRVSGVAPHANIVSYQVCWAGGQGAPYAGCPQETTLKAIDDAIADGVDVINYSIGGAEQYPWQAPTELAFLAAREAGISVAASAGNAGSFWMDHVSPWVTTVAASTHGRVITSKEKTIDGFTGGEESPSPWGPMRAASITGGYTGPVVLAADYDSANASCDAPFTEGTFSFYPDGSTLATSPIVVCQRSDQARVAKADNIRSGGAGAMILYNLQQDWEYESPDAVKVADYYSLPTAHIGAYDGSKVVEWLAAGIGHTATISDGSLYTEMGEADELADFSSRGPSKTNPHIMTPTLAAPGVDVFAAYANDRIFTMTGYGMNWAAISGTSMASPHVAGAMALIKNARPDWSPAEIQSALTTTATQASFAFDDGGAGVVNVANAINATLTLDETIENYQNADPLVGGDIKMLNMPYLVNRECEGSCSWFRVVTATEDGSWNVSAEEIGYTGASLMNISVTPTNFSLSAGESQRIMVTAKLPDIDFQSDSPLGQGNTNGYTFQGQLQLTPMDSGKPQQVLPIITTYKKADLPVIIEANIGREQGEFLSPELVASATDNLSAVVYGMAKGEQQEYHLKMNTEWPFDMEDSVPSEDSQIGYRFFEVPEGTKRLIVEIAEEDNFAKFVSHLSIGRDVNNDGKIHWDNEAICVSDWRMRDYCAINNPEPGQYWYMLTNMKWGLYWEDPYDMANRFVTNVVLVSDQASGEVSVSPTSSDGFTPQSLNINWDLPSAVEGDVYHGAIALGTDTSNTEDIGLIPLRLTRTSDDVQLTSSHTGANVGDIVDFELVHQANLNGLERELNLTVELPAGMTLIEDSVRGNEFFNSMTTETQAQQLMINGTQPSSKDDEPRYEFTTSLEDEMCRLPFSDQTHFLDLEALGVPQLPGFDSTWNQMFEIPDFVGADKYFPHIPLYGVSRDDTTNIITIMGNGLLKFDAHVIESLPGYTLEFDGIKDLVVAPYWRKDGVTINESGIDFDTFTPYSNGLFAAALNDSKYLGVQWKKMYGSIPGWFGAEIDYETHYNFSILASTEIDFTPNVYELIFTYEEMNDDKGEHTIGLKGYQGVRGFYYPVNGFHVDDYAVNEPEKFGSNMVICANYQGPESTRLVTRFSAKVTSAAVASDNDVMVSATLSTGNTVNKSVAVPVAGNITVFDMADHQIDENTVLEGIAVEYMHSQNRAVSVSASGDNVTVTADGAMLTITPAADWHGETEVTVTVMDSTNQQDQASTSFMLTVMSDGVEPSTPVTPEPEPETDSSGSSLGWLALMMLALVGFGRRKH